MDGKVIFTGILTFVILLSSCSKQIALTLNESGFKSQISSENTLTENVTNSEKSKFTSVENFSEQEKKVFENFTGEEETAFARVLSLESNSFDPQTGIPNSSQAEQNIGLDLRAPAPNGVSFSNPLHLDFRYQNSSDFNLNMIVRLDDYDISAKIRKGLLKSQWLATIENLSTGSHKLSFFPAGKPGDAYETTFQHQTKESIDRITELADTNVKRLKIKDMKWDWGEALLLYALARLDSHKHETRYQSFIESYYAYHLKKGIPEINWSDRCAPALAALELYRKTNNPVYKEIGEKVIKYLKEAKRTKAGGLNHLGTYVLSIFYPESMWVDSLMMYNVFAAKWGKYQNDPQMTKFASEQPVFFAEVLQNRYTKLWKHAYLTKLKRNIPDSEVYWLRGNGWAMASMSETLDLLPADNPKRPEILKIFNDTARALLPYQSENGMWYTVLNEPGKTYLESSGTALVAYGMLKGIHQGYLPGEYMEPARKAYLSLLDRLEQREDGVSMPEISDNTMPYNFLGYSLIPQHNDLAFGLAAIILAGIEYDSSKNNI